MIEMITSVVQILFSNPAMILLVGAALLPLVPQSEKVLNPRNILALCLPLLSCAVFWQIPLGSSWSFSVLGFTLNWLHLDRLAFVFVLIFHIALLLGQIYALHVRSRMEQSAAVIYAGSAIGAVLAGDLLTLFIWWEMTAISSVFLLLANRAFPRTQILAVAMRYFIVQVASGLALLTGLTLRYLDTGSLAFSTIDPFGAGGVWILFAFGIKCAFPLLHNWLQDAYPHATPSGAVILSAFTTKLAVYALARGFAGFEYLIVIGVIMTAFPIFFAVIENNMRRVLAYSLNNQLGFMVAGIGIGTELAINGAVAHAFAHIIYKALLFMAMGAVLYRTQEIRASHLGGLYKSMPWTATFCIIGALSISAFPLLSGFVTKSMILSAAAFEGHHWAWLVLLFASAGVLDHSGIKIPFFTFFAHDSGKRCHEAPKHMLLAMFLASALCIAIGVYPEFLYRMLPYAVDYHAYEFSHVLTQMQLLLFATGAFVFLYLKGWYPAEIPSVNLDFDYLYRRLLPNLLCKATLGGQYCLSWARQLWGRSLQIPTVEKGRAMISHLGLGMWQRLGSYRNEQQLNWVLQGTVILLVLLFLF